MNTQIEYITNDEASEINGGSFAGDVGVVAGAATVLTSPGIVSTIITVKFVAWLAS